MGAEILTRRLAAIIDAYGEGGKVDWQAAKFFRGQSQVDEVIAPGLRSYVHRRAKEDSDLQSARHRVGLRGAAKETEGEKHAEGDDGEHKEATQGGQARGRGRGRQGRQVSPKV